MHSLYAHNVYIIICIHICICTHIYTYTYMYYVYIYICIYISLPEEASILLYIDSTFLYIDFDIIRGIYIKNVMWSYNYLDFFLFLYNRQAENM